MSIEMPNHIKEDLIKKVESAVNNTYNVREKFLNFIHSNPTSFYGRDKPEHITSSVLVVNSEHKEVLLTHHKKFNKWLQLGGHWMDGDTAEGIFDGGIREVFEEAYGNEKIPYLSLNNENPIDLDCHVAGKDFHYDICFLIEVDKSIPFVVSNESENLEWVKIDDIISDIENKKYESRLIRLCYFTLAELNKNKTIENTENTPTKRIRP